VIPEVPAALRIAARCGWALIATSLIALAGAVRHDRAQCWAQPRWDPASFTVLQDHSAADTAETWAVAFQPECPHCRESLQRARRAAGCDPAHPQVALLVIDAPRTLAERAAQTAPGLPVWWDEHQTWRQRWGHRSYGEVLRFAPDGRYRGRLPDLSSAPATTRPR